MKVDAMKDSEYRKVNIKVDFEEFETIEVHLIVKNRNPSHGMKPLGIELEGEEMERYKDLNHKVQREADDNRGGRLVRKNKKSARRK